MPLFSVSQFTTWHQTFEQDVDLYRRLGVTGIEVCERKLSPDPGQAREQLALLAAAGLRVTSVQPRVHAVFSDFMCPDLADPQVRMARYRQTIDLVAAALPGQNVPLVTITGNAPGWNYRDAHRTLGQAYRELAAYAADHGVRVMFEPLAPILMNHDTFVCTLAEALAVIEAVDNPTFGLMLDVWHLWREPDIQARVAAVGGRLFGVHVSDWPADEPRCHGDRRVIGEGVIDLAGLLAATEAAGYRGAYCLEIFSADHLPDSLWRADPARVIRDSREGFVQAWRRRKR